VALLSEERIPRIADASRGFFMIWMSMRASKGPEIGLGWRVAMAWELMQPLPGPSKTTPSRQSECQVPSPTANAFKMDLASDTDMRSNVTQEKKSVPDIAKALKKTVLCLANPPRQPFEAFGPV
jgi:hypothetical protein